MSQGSRRQEGRRQETCDSIAGNTREEDRTGETGQKEKRRPGAGERRTGDKSQGSRATEGRERDVEDNTIQAQENGGQGTADVTQPSRRGETGGEDNGETGQQEKKRAEIAEQNTG